MRSRVTVLGDDPPPGHEGQIDYGYLGSWVDPVGGRLAAGVGFCDGAGLQPASVPAPGADDGPGGVDCLPCRGVRVLRGCAARPVPDNLRTGVDRADLYDPQINRSYAELAAHYGVLIDPARARKPRDKPRVERPMPYCRDSFFRGREFTSLAQMQRAAVDWSATSRAAGPAGLLDGAAPLAVFQAVELAELNPLPRSARPLLAG